MKTLVVSVSLSLFAISAFAFPDYEPFSDSTASSGTAFATGENLIGQINSSGRTWFQAGPTSTTQPTIGDGDLLVPGLLSAGGGHSAVFGGSGTSARMNLGIGAGGIQSGTVYFSFAVKLSDVSTLNAGGVFWAGFNNTQGAQTTTPNTVVTRVVTRTAGEGLFNVGLDKSSGSTGSFVWAPGDFTTSDTIFLVGSYTFNAGTGDDVSQLWVNPDSSTFGAETEPGGALMSTSGGDIARVASFVLYDRSTSEPASGAIDDLRFGLSWADVTPVPEPSSVILLSLGASGVLLARRFRKSI